MSWFSNPFSLRSQVAWAFGLLVVVLSGSLSLVLAAMSIRQAEREEGHQLRIVAGHVSQVLAAGLEERMRQIEVLAKAEAVWLGGLDTVRVAENLARAQAIQPDNSWIGVTDDRGVVKAATGKLMEGRDVSERPWFAPALKGAHIGDVHPAKLLASLLPAPSNGEPLRFLDFAAPIKVKGQTVGVLVAHGSWEWAHSVVDRFRPVDADQKALESFIFDRTGKLIYSPPSANDVKLPPVQQLPLRADELPKGSHASVVRWNDGLEYLTTAQQVVSPDPENDLGWTVVSREPVSIAFAAAHRAALKALGLGLGFAAFAAWLAWVLADHLARPLSQMAAAARAVERGRPGASIPQLDSSREVHRLARSLSSMTDKLQRANAELEHRVRERTEALERANEELVKLARHDPLTGALNRRGFAERLSLALASAARRDAPVTVVVVDADHFKKVNDTHGHDVGDLTLCAIAHTLKGRLRESDAIARFGGEEFVVLLPDTDGRAGLHVANSLVGAMAGVTIPQVGQVTISAGVAEVVVRNDDGQAALRRADEALYQAKAQGRNRAVCLDVAPEVNSTELSA